MNTAEQKRHLGGLESEAKLLDRHRRYLSYNRPGDVEVFRVSVEGEIVGAVIYWEREQDGETIYEMGWEILSAHGGRGLGTAAAAAVLARLQPVAAHRYVYATPTPENAGSNGICRKLGFDLLGTGDFEYPAGTVSPHNIWRLDLPSWTPPAA